MRRLDADPRIQLYRPVAQSPSNAIGQLDVIVRTTADPARSIGAARAAVHEVDRDLPLARIATVEDRVAASMGQRRLSAILLGTFAARSECAPRFTLTLSMNWKRFGFWYCGRKLRTPIDW